MPGMQRWCNLDLPPQPTHHLCNSTKWNKISRSMTKPTIWPVRSAKIQNSLGIHPVWSEFACAQWVANDPMFLHVDAQADLSLCWTQRSFCWFCHAAAQIGFQSKHIREAFWLVSSRGYNTYRGCIWTYDPSFCDIQWQPTHVEKQEESSLTVKWPTCYPNHGQQRRRKTKTDCHRQTEKQTDSTNDTTGTQRYLRIRCDNLRMVKSKLLGSLKT